MTEVEDYRRLAEICRQRAAARSKIEDRKLMLDTAAEFERMAQVRQSGVRPADPTSEGQARS